MIDYRSPKYVSIPLLMQKSDLPIIRFPQRPLFVRVQNQRIVPIQTPKRDSQNTSLTLSQTNEKLCSISSEISHMSTFYQSYEQPKETKGFDWQSFRQNVKELKIQHKENEAVLKKTNSFHLNGKFNRNLKNQRACKPNISEVLTPPNREICFDQQTVERQLTRNDETNIELPTQKSPQTKRKSNSIQARNKNVFDMQSDIEYSYRKANNNNNIVKTTNTSFFQSVDSNLNECSMLGKKRSYSMKLSTQSQVLKEMIDKAITNTKNFDDFIQTILQ